MIRIERHPPTNWPALIGQPQALGYSLGQIGDALSISRYTVWKWKRGACPNYGDGATFLWQVALLATVADGPPTSGE